MQKTIRLKFIVIIPVLILLLSSCNLPGRSPVEIAITSHENGQAVILGEEARIVSVAASSKGITSVELYINGDLLETATPPEGTPKTFTADQPYTPGEEGNVIISVVAYDAKGNHSQPVSVTLAVVQSLEGTGETPEPTPTLTPEGLDQTQTAAVGCTNEATFVSDMTIPANTVLSAGSNFTKIWRVNNPGSCDWIGYQLVHASGDLLGASSPQAIPLVTSGSNGDLSVEMTAPGSHGTYTSTWRLRASDGTVFGPDLSVTIIVPQSPTNTPNPTATFTPTVTPTPTTAPVSVDSEHETLSISGGATVNTTVNCPSGSVVVSGGYAANDGVRVWHTRQYGNGWGVYATNTTGVNKSISIYAVCLYNSGGTTDLEWDYEHINPNDVTQITTSCPAGTLVTGGGWVIGTDPNVQIYNSSMDGNGWQIYVNNTGGSSPQVNVYATCLSGVSGTTDMEGNTGNSIPAGDIAHVTVDCPGAGVVTGGGFAANFGITIFNETITGNIWNVYARNNTASSKTLNGYGICYYP